MLAPQDDLTLGSTVTQFIRGRDGVEIGRMADFLSSVGKVAILGGMPRDFARTGSSENFRSDVDLVVDAPAAELRRVLRPHSVKFNRFGGCRFHYGAFEFDVWALENTWAVASGYVPAQSLSDLINTTFFDCDAVVYHCESGAISSTPGFWRSLHKRRIDINLEFNPHRVGTLARTLRALLDWQLDLSPKLESYLLAGLVQHGTAVARYTQDNTHSYRFARVLDMRQTINRLSDNGTDHSLDFQNEVRQLRAVLSSEAAREAV